MKTELKYKTFTELLNEVSIDFTMYNTENLLDPAQLMKVAQRVTYDLGLRIHGTKNVFMLSAAVFPTGSNSNPTFTVLALANRLANKFL